MLIYYEEFQRIGLLQITFQLLKKNEVLSVILNLSISIKSLALSIYHRVKFSLSTVLSVILSLSLY